MIKSGITFWQLPSDEEQFLSFLSTTGRIVAYTAPWKKKREYVQPVLLSELIHNSDTAQLMFGPDTGEAPVEAHSFDGEVHYNVRIEISCLVMYSRGKLQQGVLTQSNLSLYWVHYHLNRQSNRFVRKDESFISWAKKVLSWMRKATPEWHEHKSYRATRAVKLALERGEIELKKY